MKQTNNNLTARTRALASGFALVAMILASPLTASAVAPSEGAKILNVATVTYNNTAGVAQPPAAAAATVTVTLKAAQLSVTGPNGTGAADCPPTPVNSGETSVVMNAISANANGDDIYTIATAITTNTDVANESVSFTLYDSAGTVIPYNAPGILLGSAISIGVKNVVGADTLLFDGAVDLETMFAVGDIVVVKTGSPVAYKVASRTNGTPAAHSNDGGGTYSVAGSETTMVPGELVLEAFTVTIGGTPYGTNAAPAFVYNANPALGTPAAGTIVGEMVLVEVSVTADSTSQTTDGVVGFDFTTEDSGTGTTTTDSCSVTFNRVSTLNIQKLVRNTLAGGFAATATGKSGDTLEYQITITNPNASDAEAVIVTDAVPEYTTLVATGDVFATAELNGDTVVVDITMTADDEDGNIDVDHESPAVASGNAAGTTAGSAIIFYLGAGNADTTDTGGTLTENDAVVLLYQVTID